MAARYVHAVKPNVRPHLTADGPREFSSRKFPLDLLAGFGAVNEDRVHRYFVHHANQLRK